jgi:hypothetical protein
MSNTVNAGGQMFLNAKIGFCHDWRFKHKVVLEIQFITSHVLKYWRLEFKGMYFRDVTQFSRHVSFCCPWRPHGLLPPATPPRLSKGCSRSSRRYMKLATHVRLMPKLICAMCPNLYDAPQFVRCAPIRAMCPNLCEVPQFVRCALICVMYPNLCDVSQFVRCAPICAMCPNLYDMLQFVRCVPICALCPNLCDVPQFVRCAPICAMCPNFPRLIKPSNNLTFSVTISTEVEK